jgi:hypothetical protein
MFYIYRKHTLPCSVPSIEVLILEVYLGSLKEKGALMTSFEMRRIIKSFWKREDVWNEYDIIIPVISREVQMNAINSESLDQFWLDWKPKKADFSVSGRLPFKRVACPICKEAEGHKIKLRNCSCIFHKQCIEMSVKYSDVCPVCETTIYKEKIIKQTCNENEGDL